MKVHICTSAAAARAGAQGTQSGGAHFIDRLDKEYPRWGKQCMPFPEKLKALASETATGMKPLPLSSAKITGVI
jgi:hypothetical protein